MLQTVRYAFVFAAIAVPVGAQTSAGPSPQTPATAPTTQALATPADTQAKSPDSLTILFDEGSAAIRPNEEATLDQASRLYRDGKPVVMVVSGATNSVGSADGNLRLSVHRANVVVRELVARGIPVERFQLLGKGETEPAVQAQKGTPEPRNRRVEITWR